MSPSSGASWISSSSLGWESQEILIFTKMFLILELLAIKTSGTFFWRALHAVHCLIRPSCPHWRSPSTELEGTVFFNIHMKHFYNKATPTYPNKINYQVLFLAEKMPDLDWQPTYACFFGVVKWNGAQWKWIRKKKQKRFSKTETLCKSHHLASLLIFFGL